jgi:predicted nucleotidyltransferase
MRVSPYLKEQFLKAANMAFGKCELILFGSRIDNDKTGGDFDIAIDCNMKKEEFKKAKVKFFKYLILKDLDLPIDLVHYNTANKLLKREIQKGEKLNSTGEATASPKD